MTGAMRECLASRAQPRLAVSLRAIAGAVVAVSLTVVIAGIGAVAWWSSVKGSEAPDDSVRYSLGDCRAFEEPVGAQGYRAAAPMALDPLMLGADVGVSARLADGRMLWAFGDTFRSPEGSGVTGVRNSMLIAGLGCRRMVLPPDGGEVIPDRGDGVGYWPMSLTVLTTRTGSRVHVFAQRVRDQEQEFAFVNLGPAIATFDVSSGQAPELVTLQDLGGDSASRDTVGWGAAVTDGGDGYVYIFGTANPDALQASPHHMLVSVSRNSLDPVILERNPDIYRPFFVDIQLPPEPLADELDPRG